jgi:hypothetical protein
MGWIKEDEQAEKLMKSQTVWQGRRIPVVPGATDEQLDPYHLLTQPGDYYGPVMGFTLDRPAVFFLLPTATASDPKWGGAPQDGMHHVCCPPHSFIEEADGTLTIRESIGTSHWHGYLTNGRWELSKSKP